MADISKLIEAVKKAKRVYLVGNGGSAANALHLCNDLISVGIKAHALTANVATLTAIANDHSYRNIFSTQLSVLGEREDLLIVLSGSGKSPNIIYALAEARLIGMDSVAIVGKSSKASDLATFSIIEGPDMQPAEEAQLRIGHELMLALKKERHG